MNYRHGDLLIKTLDKIPSNAKVVSNGKLNVLALGEVTGHRHVLETTTGVEVFELEGDKYFTLKELAILSHEEHKTLTLEPQTYKVLTEREYNYFDKELIKVRD